MIGNRYVAGHQRHLLLLEGDSRNAASDDSPPTTSIFVYSRTLMGCADNLLRGVGAPHQCPLGSVARYLIYADVRTFR